MEGEGGINTGQENPKSVEISPPREALPMTVLIEKGGIKKNPEYGKNGKYFGHDPYIIDDELAEKLFTEDVKKDPPPLFSFGEERIKQESEQAFKKVVKSFVDNGVITPDLAVQVGRIIRPTDISTPNADWARFLYLDKIFPSNKDGRGNIEMGTQYVNGWGAQQMKDVLDKQGVHLNQDQLLQLVVRNTIAHEYGHAVDRTIALLQTANQAGKEPGKDLYEIIIPLEDKMSASLYEYIAPNMRLQEVFVGQPKEGPYVRRGLTSSERIAVGFENLGQQFSLRELGIAESTIDNIIKEYQQLDNKKLESYSEMAKVGLEKGLNLQEIGEARIQLSSQLKDKGRDNTLVAQISPNVRVVGYYFPLDRSEIKAYIDQWYTPPIQQAA
jgi:hypothetical protein